MAIFGGFDWPARIIFFVAVVVGGLTMGRVAQLVNVTVGALIFFVLAREIYGIAMGNPIMQVGDRLWNGAQATTLAEFVIFAVLFGLAILVVYLLRSMVRRSD